MTPDRIWVIFLWFLSGLVFSRTPLFCNAMNKRKGSPFTSDDNLFQKSYSLEDFFWTGSGDGPPLEDSFGNTTNDEPRFLQEEYPDTWRTTTVFHTTSVLFATVYPNWKSCSEKKCKPRTSPVWTGSIEFFSPAFPPFTFAIEPTPSRKHFGTSGKSKNVTIFSEVTKTLTVTERVTANGRGFDLTPAMTSARSSPATSVLMRNFTNGYNSADSGTIDQEVEGSAFPRFDPDFNMTTATIDYNTPVDQRYWLLTVLRRDRYSPELKVSVMEKKLSALYRKAFIRQQEKHLGIGHNSSTTFRPRRDRRISEPVRVHIHNMSDGAAGEINEVGLLYSVTVAGKPVPALTAANDMKLMSMNEVVAELGYPVLTKAEPYLKGIVPLGARVKGRTRDTWLLIGSVIAAVCLLIVLAALFTFGLSQRASNHNSAASINNKRHIFEAEEGNSNLAFQADSDLKVKNSSARQNIHSSKFDSSRAVESSGGAIVTFADQRRGSSSSSTYSGSSETSLVRLRHQQKKKELLDEKPRPRPRTRIRRVENTDSAMEDTNNNRGRGSSALSRDHDSFGGITTEGLDDTETTPRVTRTPPSYLSMPSVKAFPRGAKIPEPLSRVLEPISIRRLDDDQESFRHRQQQNRVLEEDYETDYLQESDRMGREKGMTRHASLEDDPGVIGPIVWKRHCQKSKASDRNSVDITEIEEAVNIGKMRRRFNDLIDDAFSMFGSRSDSVEDGDKYGSEIAQRSMDSRIQSAANRPVESFCYFRSSDRPKTTDSKRPITVINQGPRGAWDSPSYATTSKFTVTSSPTIDKCSVLVDSKLSPSDPAIPLIKAIKNELQKFDQIPAKCTDNT